MRRTVAATIGLTLLALAGCGGSDGPAPAETPTPSAPASTTATDPVTSEPTASYLPVPDGVTLDEPGTALKLKDRAIAAWQPRQDVVGVVDVAVQRIERTTVERSLSGFELEASAKRSTPYFVTLRVQNVGSTSLGAFDLPVYAVDEEGTLVAATGVARDFEACPGSTLPAVFAPGDGARSCLIYLVPEGHELASVIFQPPPGVVPLTWTGRIDELGKDDQGKGDQGEGDQGKGDQGKGQGKGQGG